jgi:hypothetical protein
MNERRLRTLGQARHRARVEYERAHGRAIRAAVDELTRDPAGEVSKAAELVGVTRPTIYSALKAAAVMAEHEARAAGDTPPPAPADYDWPGNDRDQPEGTRKGKDV